MRSSPEGLEIGSSDGLSRLKVNQDGDACNQDGSCCKPYIVGSPRNRTHHSLPRHNSTEELSKAMKYYIMCEETGADENRRMISTF